MAKGNFGQGLVAELGGFATRDGVSSFNLENFLFGTLGHFIIGVSITKAVMKVTHVTQKGIIRKALPKSISESKVVGKLDIEKNMFATSGVGGN